MILLVNPWIHDFAAYDLWMKPLGLLYLGGFLEQRGYPISLIDCLAEGVESSGPYNCGHFRSQVIAKPDCFSGIPRKYKRYGITPAELAGRLKALPSEPDLVLVTSMMTYWYTGVAEIIAVIRKAYPKSPIALGGVYATLCAEHARRNSGADYVITGPGEEQVLELVKTIGINPVSNTPNTESYPAYHLYPGLKSAAMITSRGCPFRCSYCASAELNDGYTCREPSQVIDEINYYISDLGVEDIAFYDDALLFDSHKHIEPIIDGIISRGLNQKARFHTPNGLHISLIDKQLAGKLCRAGFKTIRLGFESVSRQEDSSRKTASADLPRTLGYLYQSGFKPVDVGVYVLMGLPGQALEEVDQSIEFVHKSGGIIKMAQYAPVPGTPDFLKAAKELPQITAEPLLHNKSVYSCRMPGVGFDDLEAIKDKAKQLNSRLKPNT
ncbi:MAG: radical SAM protein [Candidatus Brocadiia bacterium]